MLTRRWRSAARLIVHMFVDQRAARGGIAVSHVCVPLCGYGASVPAPPSADSSRFPASSGDSFDSRAAGRKSGLDIWVGAGLYV